MIMEVETGNINMVEYRDRKKKGRKTVSLRKPCSQREASKLKECERCSQKHGSLLRATVKGRLICYDVLSPTRPNSYNAQISAS